MTDDKRLKRFERNMSKINDKKLDYKTVDNEWIQIKTIWGEMLCNPYSNHFRLEGKLRDEFRRKILCSKNELEIREAVNNFSCNGFDFEEFWGVESREYRYHYIWLCYAIVWV